MNAINVHAVHCEVFNMQKKIIFLTVLLGAIITYWFYLQSDYHAHLAVAHTQAADFSVKDENGKTVHLSDFRGKLVLLHFWASWCPPCVGEFPMINALYNSMPKDKFVLLAVSVDEDGIDAIKKFRTQVPFDFTVYLNPDQKIAEKYGTYGLPESYLIDQQGNIIQKIVGPQNWKSPVWKEKLNSLL